MRELFFPYKRVHSNIFGRVSIPVAKIFLQDKNEIAVDVIIDSGAVISIFPRSLSDILGLSFEEGEKGEVRTASGETIGIRVHMVRMRIEDYVFMARAAFSENEFFLNSHEALDYWEVFI